jgi:cell division transport system permease protein
MRWRFFISEAMTSIRSNAATTLAAVVTVLIVTFLLGFTVSAGKWVYDYTVGVRNDVTIKAYVPDAMAKNTAELGAVQDRIQGIQYVKTVTYVSPEKALTLLTKSERKNIQLLPGNPLPPSFWVKLTDPSKVNQVADELGTIPQIKGCDPPGPCVSYGQKITNQVLDKTEIVLVALAVFIILLVVAAVVLIQNTIRLSIFSRRREIEVMKLVGATNSFVRLPFMLEGMMTGLAGAVSAVVLLSFVYVALNNIHHGLTDPARAVGIPLLIGGLSLFGLALGAFSSMLTLRRFLRV